MKGVYLAAVVLATAALLVAHRRTRARFGTGRAPLGGGSRYTPGHYVGDETEETEENFRGGRRGGRRGRRRGCRHISTRQHG